MGFITFLSRRLLHSVFVLLEFSIIVFLSARVMPGDPVRMALGPRVPDWVVERFRESLHLDRPLYTQYHYWIRGALHGDF